MGRKAHRQAHESKGYMIDGLLKQMSMIEDDAELEKAVERLLDAFEAAGYTEDDLRQYLHDQDIIKDYEWVEEDHPRVPKGDPDGGQFTSVDEGSPTTTGEGGPIKDIAELVSKPSTINPEIDKNNDGITDAARVGVPGMSSPPPPDSIPRLPNLTPHERLVESRFADAYEADPQQMVDAYLAQVAKSSAPNTFSTDDAKMLDPDYAKSNDNKAIYNVAVHQTANAIAKKAFVEYLDKVVSQLPPDKRTVLVTAGGVAAGKGYALENSSAADVAKRVGAVWDTAGEQNSTELPWVLKEASMRGIKATFAYVDADPITTFERVVSRAQKNGRMVDADLYADSYAIGARNFLAFANSNKATADFIYLSNRGKPSVVNFMPSEALVDREKVYDAARNYLKSKAGTVSTAIMRGGLIGRRIWH